MQFYICRLLFCFAVMNIVIAKAQDTKVYIINPGQTIQEVIPDTVRYSYTDFRSGIVLFPRNEAATALVNYNLMLGEMQFIDPKGDTLYIGDPEKFERIAVGLDTFFFNNGYLRQMAYKNKVRLLQKQTIRMASRTTLGAFDQPAQGAATTYSSFFGNTHDVTLRTNQKITFKKETYYFLMDRNQTLYPLSLKNLQLLFPKDRKLLESSFHGKNIYDPSTLRLLIQYFLEPQP
jgi:hypothetical protein